MWGTCPGRSGAYHRNSGAARPSLVDLVRAPKNTTPAHVTAPSWLEKSSTSATSTRDSRPKQTRANRGGRLRWKEPALHTTPIAPTSNQFDSPPPGDSH